MEVFQPVEAGSDQKALHLPSAEIVDVGVPVVMESLARILMLVQRGAVEPCHAMRIGRKVCRHPVEENADAGAMAGIDEAGKTLWRTEPGAWREQAERLIAPRAAERMLAYRHQLDMGETHLAGIG